MQVTVSFPLFQLENILTLPYDAIQTSERGGSVAWIPGPVGGKPERKKVRIGATNFAKVEVLEGLSEGDTVLIRKKLPAPRGGGGGH
jgi:multidrug efflux pump subunit AcrA (membrane-fusion protein)